MARGNRQPAEKPVNEEHVIDALAKAVADGDIVNFRLLFAPFSPARKSSTERFDSNKYAYLLPNGESNSKALSEARAAVKRVETIAHIRKELEERRPAQYPWELVLMLGDNAVRAGKYRSAAQAYELLRIRRRMQQLFFEEGDAALDAGDMERGVQGYRTAAGLAYDYAAFPEPLPLVPNYQTEALKLHGVYPLRPEDCVAVQEPETHVQVALEYLLIDPEAAARLRGRTPELRLAFLKEIVRQIDPNWETFVARYREAIGLARELGQRLQRQSGPARGADTLEDEIEEIDGGNPVAVPAKLLGRRLDHGEWWQYMKELAYLHPAAVLFVARQAVGDQEILMPRYRAGSKVPQTLHLVDESSASAGGAAAP